MNMQDKKENTENSKETPKGLFNRTFRFVRKLVLWLFLFLFIISLIIIGISQTKTFRKFFTNFALGIVNNELVAKVEIGDLKINPFRGIEIENFRMITRGDTFASASRLFVKIRYSPLLSGRIVIKKLTMENATVKLLRSKSDSSWNVDYIAKPLSDTSVSGPSKIKIDVLDFVMKNGRFLLYDSVNHSANNGSLNYSDLDIRNLNLKMTADAALENNKYKFNIKSASLSEFNSKLIVKSLNINGRLDTNGVFLKSFRLVTDGSDISLNGSLTKFNVFGTIDDSSLAYSFFDFMLDGKTKLSEVNQVAYFEPQLGSIVRLKGKIVGTLNGMVCDDLLIETKKSKIRSKAGIRNILNSDYLVYEGFIKEAEVYRSDILEILPKMGLESIPQFHKAIIKNTYTIGTNDTIKSSFDVATRLGNAKGRVVMGLGDVFSYYGNALTQNLNLGELMNSPSLKSSLNSEITFSGRGLSIKELDSKIDLKLTNSTFSGYAIKNLILKSRIEGGGIITLDTLLVDVLTRRADNPDDTLRKEVQSLAVFGSLDLRNMNHPKYNLDINVNNLNLAFLTENDGMPSTVNGTFRLKGEGFDPDSLICNLKSDITECSFPDRSLMPFSLNIDLKRDQSGNKDLVINSELFDLSLNGNFKFDNILSLVKNQISYLAGFFINKTTLLNTTLNLDKKNDKLTRITSFAPVNFRLKANINDISTLNPLLGDLKMQLKARISLLLDVDSNESRIIIDSCNIDQFQIDQKDSKIIIKPLIMQADLNMTIKDSLPYLNKIHLVASGEGESDINGLIISKPSFKLDYFDETAGFSVSANINKLIDLSSTGKLMFDENKYSLELSQFNIAYNSGFAWHAKEPIVVALDTYGLEIKTLKLSRENAEIIQITGKANTGNFDNLNINISNLPLNDINKLLPPDHQSVIKSFRGKFEDISVKLNGSFENPQIDAKILTSVLKVNNIDVGQLNGQIIHRDSVISGNLKLLNKNFEYLSLMIRKLPINLAISGVKDRVRTDQTIDVLLRASDLPVSLAEPFVPVLQNLKGKMDASLTLGGFLPEKLTYEGYAKIKNTSFLLQPTNMNYIVNGTIDFEPNKISTSNFSVYNITEDLRDGVANVNAVFNFENLAIKNFDIKMSTRKFKLLSAASMRSMPTLYGDFIISTGASPLSFSGNFDKPVLGGDINVIRADLTLPQSESSASGNYSSKVKYELVGKKMYVKVLSIDSLENDSLKITQNGDTKTTEISKSETSFNNRLSYDLYVKIPGRFMLTIDLNIIAQIYAEIGTQDRSQPLHIVKAPFSDEIRILGGNSIVLRDGSTLNYLKLFKTSGSIYFPTGKVDNPGLNLTAVYSGSSYYNDKSRDFKVFLNVTGTKNLPNIKFNYSVNDEPAPGDSSLITQNALFLLATGKTKSELESGGNGSSFNWGEIGTSSTSALISKMATDLLSGTGIIQSADIDLSGGSVEKASLKLTGQLFGNVVWRVGGTVADIASNNEISIDIPLGIVIHPELLNNIIIQLTKSTSLNQSFSRSQKVWEVKLKFGGSW